MTNDNKARSRRTRVAQTYNILLLETHIEEAKTLLPLAERIALDRRGKIIILSVICVPEGDQMSGVAKKASRLREVLKTFLESTPIPTLIKTIVRTEGELWEGVGEFVVEEKIDLLIAHWSTTYIDKDFPHNLEASKLLALPCDVTIVRPSLQVVESDNWQSMQGILLPVRGGVNAGLSLRVGHALARIVDATITLLHVAAPGSDPRSMRFFEEFSPAVSGLKQITRTVTAKGEISNAITAESKNHQAIVIGAPSNELQPNTWIQALLDEILGDDERTLVLVNEFVGDLPSISIPSMDTIKRDRPLAVVVDNWFAENTYHTREFMDLDRLIELKENQEVKISLALPALNEEATVGNVIETVKTALMDQVPLLDEMVLIDSGSKDRTREIASEFGIPVHIHQEILPEYGSYIGKGEALWKSLYVVNGDIVAWIDTDIKNIDPRFVYGILGPLLDNPEIKFSKGFYRRPLKLGDKTVAGGGGRVTELTARPFINLFFPDLSGLIQPLSGEYAGRRSALEKLPFFTGYGVETGMLIDMLGSYGLDSIAQVDLLERIHHNQPLPSLSKMSFTIMQVVLSRLEARNKIHIYDESNLTMNLVRHSKRRGYYLDQEEIHEHERPPMETIAEYQEKFQIK
jgi:glycosyltransferase involved in cell wall biosynthesis